MAGRKLRAAGTGDIGDEQYAVAWSADGLTAEVKHYPDTEARRACCRVSVEVSDGDRAHAFDYEIVKGQTHALQRAYLAIERKHGRIEVTG